uniref:Uncharacterized protein MANES_16G101100 n=1 Tax=Rhizophora mucronata TaxID=61149 RepID=A0A2P2KPW2_RHIMU
METFVCNFNSVIASSLIARKPTSPSSVLPLDKVGIVSSRNPSVFLRPRMAHSVKEDPVHQQQKVVIPNKHRENLVGLFHDTGSKEIVILCHGFRSTKVVCSDI